MVTEIQQMGSSQRLLERAQSSIRDGRVPAKIYNDPEIFELEKERIFARAYIYLAHESEIPDIGDYVVRYIADDSFIVVRDAQRKIQILFNCCGHRGMQVCRAEMGNATHFRCPYHGWTFKTTGALVGVPAAKEAYGDKLDKAKWGLRPVPRWDVYNGMIFASLDENAPPLTEYLGDMTWYLDLVTKRSEAGLEVVGAPHRWIVDANWKLGADNFIGDAYHTLMTHHSAVDLKLAPGDPKFAMYGVHVHAGNGHGLGMISAPPGMELPPFWGYPEEMVQSLQRSYPTPEQVAVARRINFLHGTVFPNFSVLNVMIAKDHRSAPTPMLTFRVWRPVGPDRTEVWSWFLVERDAPEWFKERSYQTYVHTFGTSGVFEQDDTENWRSITRMAKGLMARVHELNYQMGMDHLSLDPTWPGPGEAYPLDYAEANQRAFIRQWLQYMMNEI